MCLGTQLVTELGLKSKSGMKVWCSFQYFTFLPKQEKRRKDLPNGWTKQLLSNVTTDKRHETGLHTSMKESWDDGKVIKRGTK